MSNLGIELTAKVVKALTQYSEHQVARMYGLQLSTVRTIRMEAQQHADDLNKRRNADIFKLILQGSQATVDLKSATSQREADIAELSAIRARKAITALHMHKEPCGSETRHVMANLDYTGLERHVISGFFTATGEPTPAFWGYIANYVKKSGHALLDILHDEQIFSPEQLKEALDFDYQLSRVPLHRKLAIVNQILKEIVASYEMLGRKVRIFMAPGACASR